MRRIFPGTTAGDTRIALVERDYCDRDSGILEGFERTWVLRDNDGNIIGEDPDSSYREYRSVRRESPCAIPGSV